MQLAWELLAWTQMLGFAEHPARRLAVGAVAGGAVSGQAPLTITSAPNLMPTALTLFWRAFEQAPTTEPPGATI